MKKKNDCRHAIMLPPVERMGLSAILYVWMTKLERLTGSRREDILTFYRQRLLGCHPAGWGKWPFRVPIHPDELNKRELFLFLWDIRCDADRRHGVKLEFNLNF